MSGNGAPHSFPYLNDEFFYTAVTEPTALPATTPPTPLPFVAAPPAAAAAPPAFYEIQATPFTSATSPTFPYFRSSSNGNYVNGPSGAGYHKMLDFFEVPSPANGAIGEVSAGMNYDWARQDLKPGLININLIIDEEVFLGVMGPSLYNTYLNQGQLGMPLLGIENPAGVSAYLAANTPAVATSINDAGAPYSAYYMNNVGIWDQNGYVDPLTGWTYPYTLNGARVRTQPTQATSTTSRPSNWVPRSRTTRR